ncbi:MAG TPA: hypothetical protein VJN90_08675 [Candidatus Acidoferrales bacterium]|nr:hypothetical protein [Candidatus Acidoferrales bacterium]
MIVRIQMTISLQEEVGTFGAALLLVCGIFVVRAGAQAVTPILGEIAGDDISVLGPSHIVQGGVSRAISFGGGSAVIVHAGKARVQFVGGGELEICGPAKFSVLASGEALTIALSFGRVHAKFDSSRPITIYTPLIVATPMAIGDQPRDTTIGLMNTGAMCVLASRGAVQLQHQLNGETLIVPQPSEILLQGTSLGGARATSGSCQCDFDETGAQESVSPVGDVANQQAPPKLTPSQPKPTPRAVNKAPRTVETDSAASQTSASAQGAIAKKDEGTEQAASHAAISPLPPAKQPVATIDLPPIGYDARSGTASAEPLSVATLMLAREAKVEPEWIFHGTVSEPSRFTKPGIAAQRRQTASASQRSGQRATKKSFWRKLRDFFVGSPAKTSCVDQGCS